MSHYLLYFPGEDSPSDSILDKVGLSQLRHTGVPVYWHAILRHGPDGKEGMICCWHTGDANRDSDPAKHAEMLWTPAKADRSRDLAAGRFYFGVHPEHPPHPTDIALPKRFFGHDIACADGNWYHIPSAVKLPHEHGINESGEWERRVAARYREFYDAAMTYGLEIFSKVDAADVIRAANPDIPDDEVVTSFTLENADKHCCTALSMNYRLTPEIIDLLGLLDDTAMFGIIAATIDLPQITEVVKQKKTRSRADIPVG